MLQRGFPQVIDFLHRPFGTWIAHLLKQVDGRGRWSGVRSQGRPPRKRSRSLLTVSSDAPGQRITGQSSIDQSSDRSCTPRWLVHVIESALI